MHSFEKKQFEEIISASVPRANLAAFRKRGIPQKDNVKAELARFKHWVYVCATLNASTAAKVPLRLFATRGTGQQRVGKSIDLHISSRLLSKHETRAFKKLKQFSKNPTVQDAEEVEEIFDHPVLDLLCHVNPRQNEFDMKELTQQYLDLTGNAYWKIQMGPFGPETMWPLLPHLVRIVPGSKEVVEAYRYGLPGRDLQVFDAHEVIHFRYPNVWDPLFYGLSPLRAGMAGIDRYTHYDTYENSLLQNNGMSDLIVAYKGDLTAEQIRETERDWNARVATPFVTNRVKVTTQEYDVKELGLGPQEMSYLMGRNWTRQEICGLFGVPLSMVTTDNVNKANADAGKKQHAENAIAPRLIRIEETLNQDLIPLYDSGDRLFLAFDDPVPENQLLQIRQDESDLKNYVKTVNEVRAERGLDAVPWGEEPLAPLMIAPLSVLPPSSEDPAPEPTSSSNSEEGKAFIRFKQEIDRDRTGGGNPRLSPNELKFQRAILRIWSEQEKDFLAVLNEKGVDRLALTTEAESLGQLAYLNFVQRQLQTDLFHGLARIHDDDSLEPAQVTEFLAAWPTEERSLRERLVTVTRSIRKQSEQLAFDFDKWVKQTQSLTQSIYFDVFRQGAAEGSRQIRGETSIAEFIEAPEVVNAVDNMNLKFAEHINAEVRDKLTSQLQAGLQAGESIAQLSDRMKDVFQGLERAKRADMIARSETKRAHSQGKLELWRSTGVAVAKVWDAAGDACPFCAPLDGQIVDLDSTFKDPSTGERADPNTGKPPERGEDYEITGATDLDEGSRYEVPFKDGTIAINLNYEGISGPPLHPNCRCVLRPKVLEEQ